MLEKAVIIACLGVILLHVKVNAAGAGRLAAVLTLPGDGRVRRGSSVVLQCRQSMTNETRHTSSIVWYRRCGDVQHQLAVEQSVVGEFGTTSDGAPRVTVSRDMLHDSLVSNLTIADAYLEDSGEIICGVSSASAAAKTLSVCVDVDSALCSCIQSAGAKWQAKCFTEAYRNDAQLASTTARNAVFGLGIAVGCVLLYAVVVSIIASKDCIRQRCQRNIRSESYTRHPNDASITVLGRPPYNDSDVLQLEQSDSSSDATASCSATCSSSDTCDNAASRHPVPTAPAFSRMTARADVHSHAGAARTNVGQDINRLPSTPLSAAHHNYAYVDDDRQSERYSDWPQAQRRRPIPENDLEEMMPPPGLYPVANLTAADTYRWPPTVSEPLSVISSPLSGNAQTGYGQASGGLPVIDVHHSLNDTSV